MHTSILPVSFSCLTFSPLAPLSFNPSQHVQTTRVSFAKWCSTARFEHMYVPENVVLTFHTIVTQTVSTRPHWIEKSEYAQHEPNKNSYRQADMLRVPN